MSIDRIDVSSRYSEVAIHNGVVYLAGQVPEDSQQDIQGQTQQVLSMIDRLLAAAQSDKRQLLMVTIYLADLADYTAMNAVWDAWVVAGHAPPRACVQAQLADPRWRIEMVATAAQHVSA
ncbi:MAG: RidA family protein [Pseudomonadota bacterium]|nr:RidA family protein [Pseudomonadota bacterium]